MTRGHGPNGVSPPLPVRATAHIQLEPGDTYYLGYHEWLVHPDEATVILERGYVTVNGVRCAARQVGEFAGYPQISVYGLDEYGAASDPQCPAASAVGDGLLSVVAA